MKKIKTYYKALFLLVFLVACTEDDLRELSYLKSVELPTNIAAAYNITQDNTGLVTITPSGDGAVSYDISFGDSSTEPANVVQGNGVEHTYEEGTYEIGVIAYNLNGDSIAVTQELIVSFTAPENLVVTIENDAAISKQVNVTVTADFATMYDFYSGEDGVTDPVSGNIGDTVSYTYAEAGIYTIRVVAKGAAIETTEYTAAFEVTAILAPLTSAGTPQSRDEADVTSIFSDAYTDITGVEYNPNWGQQTIYTDFNLNGDAMIQYSNLNYQGIDFSGNVQDASSMETLHIDVWTTDATSLDIFPISSTSAEFFVTKDLVADEWNSFDIPITEFTDQGLVVSDLKQFKFEGSGTVFIDNLYFYRPASEYAPLLSDDFEGNGNITTWTGDGAGLTLNTPNIVNESINTSLSILQYEDTGGQYANIQFTADGKFDLSTGNTVYSLKIYVPSSSVTGSQPNQVSLKLQNSDLGGNSWQTQTEIVKPIVLDTWQELVFNFETDPFINLDGSSPDPVDRTDLDKVVIQVNSENNYDSATAYIDDFAYGPALPMDSPPFATDDFEGNGTITTWLGDGVTLDNSFNNPIDGSVAGMNYSSKVMLYEDTGGQYANAQFVVSPKLDLTAKNKFTLKVYVPSSSITGSQPNQISLKLQNSDLGGNSWQTQTEIVKTIVLDAWQEITFDFVNDTFINLDGGSPDPIDRIDLDKVVIQLNSENNYDSVSAYIDDLNYHK
ncbi:MAG: hypothetical protein QMB29_03205 [Urechidicola sp.]